MQCTREDEGAGGDEESRRLAERTDGLGEAIGVGIAVLYVTNYYLPQVFEVPWDILCFATGLDAGCRARSVALVAVQPVDAAMEWAGLGAPDPAAPRLSLNLAILGFLLLTVIFSITLCCYLSCAKPPLAAPIYFRRTTGSDAGKVEPLALYDGISRPPIYIAVKGRVFDVSTGTDFYGPEGGGYNALSGQDASRALGIMSLQGREVWLEDCRIRRIDDLGAKELKVMKEWEDKYVEKYPIVGVLLGTGTPGNPGFVPAEGKLEEALAGDAQQKVTHEQLTRDCNTKGSAGKGAGRKGSKKKEPPAAATAPVGAAEVSSAGSEGSGRGGRCPGGHYLLPAKTTDATFYCDGCAATALPEGTRTHSCRPCDYDLCEDCFSKQTQQEEQQEQQEQQEGQEQGQQDST